MEGNNLIWALTCNKHGLGLILEKHLDLSVSVFCSFFTVLRYWNQDLIVMFWGSFSARVIQCGLIKVKRSKTVFTVLFARNLFGLILVISAYDHVAQDGYKIV